MKCEGEQPDFIFFANKTRHPQGMIERLFYSTGFSLCTEAPDSTANNLSTSVQHYFTFKSFAILKVGDIAIKLRPSTESLIVFKAGTSFEHRHCF